MISVNEAKALSRKARFAVSGFADLAESNIRDACANGEDEASILIPLDVVNDMVMFLADNGYKDIVITGAITGAIVTVAW